MRRAAAAIAAAVLVPALVLAFILVLGGAPALACSPDIEVRFFEAAEGDLFMVANNSRDEWSLITLQIDLRGSAGHLIFDTEDGGRGASMHAPFAAAGNAVGLRAAPVVKDGDEIITLSFRKFHAGRDFTFVIHLDDRLEASDYGQATVSGAEIVGARATAAFGHADGAQAQARGRFNADGVAHLSGGLCA